MRILRRRPLSIEEILAWAGLHQHETGRWPTKDSGAILGATGDTWGQIDHALREGLRGLPGGTSLARLLAEHLGVRNIHDLPPLTENAILQWADEHFARHGTWPTQNSGTIPGPHRETWRSINTALTNGTRTLPGGSSLARLLAQRRGVRNRKDLPPYTEELILSWADAWYRCNGEWPTARSGTIPDTNGETWLAVENALRHGRRSLPGGSSLALLLAEKRDVRNAWTRPDFNIALILTWVDEHHRLSGGWPTVQTGKIAAAPEETWHAVDKALRRGLRGLPGGSSLAELLRVERGVRNRAKLPKLTVRRILRWAGAHRRRTGQWPTRDSGPVSEAPGETWGAIEAALNQGSRGLRTKSSLARLRADHGGKMHYHDRPPLTQKKILRWADAHFAHKGEWPNVMSGPVHDAPGENWKAIDTALRAGSRQLPGGSSLRRLLAKKRGVRNPANLSPLSKDQLLRWAELHRKRTGRLPRYYSGRIVDAPGETWAAVDHALRYGKRTLPPGGSLAKLLRTGSRES
jgi:hypothetical protein